MDVARIGPISPQQIDWRRLTAKEIIKYEQQGVDVPSQYLMWAKEFIDSIESDDTTTYEMAVSSTESSSNIETQNVNTEDVPAEGIPEEDNKSAVQKRKDELSSIGLIGQTVVFTGESYKRFAETVAESFRISTIESDSNREIAELSSNMERLLSQAKSDQAEIKSQISNMNEGNNTYSAIAKINSLQEKLQTYQQSGASEISSSELDINNYQAQLDSKYSPITEAGEFGKETLVMGAKVSIIPLFPTKIIAANALIAGSMAKVSSDLVGKQLNQAIDINSNNFSIASDFNSELTSITGIESEDISQDDIENTESNDNTDIGSEKPEDNPNDPANTSSANIDTILQRKIRQGINVDNPET